MAEEAERLRQAARIFADEVDEASRLNLPVADAAIADSPISPFALIDDLGLASGAA